jgi:COMPASS component SWD3
MQFPSGMLESMCEQKLSTLRMMQNYVVTGGYDKTVRLWDARTGALLRTFIGHNSAVSRVIFNPLGNLVISGSKDYTIKFWDLVSGVCVKTYSSHFGEVTSVEMNKAGSLLLSGSKDNSNRLWDVRLARPIRRFKGHQNTSKNFVRASFGPDDSLVVGGSEVVLLIEVFIIDVVIAP